MMRPHFVVQVLSTLLAGSFAVPTAIRPVYSRGIDGQQNATRLTDILPSAEIYTPSSPEWDEGTRRWSTYSAPTFDLLFIPKNEQEISQAVCCLRWTSLRFC